MHLPHNQKDTTKQNPILNKVSQNSTFDIIFLGSQLILFPNIQIYLHN